MAAPGGNQPHWREPNLRDRIEAASRELKLARRDGSAEWIAKAAAALDACIDEIPRTEHAKS
jgi:hypothetical protein